MFYLFGAIGIFVIISLIWEYRKAKNKKSFLIKNTVGLIVVTFLLFLFGPFFIISPIKFGYSSLIEGNITLYYPTKKIDSAHNLMEQLKQAEAENKNFYQTTYKMPVVLATSSFDMLRFGSYPTAGGTGNELGINIREGRMTTGKIAHEMSHRNLALLTGKSGAAFPRWFDEGLASYIGKMDEYKKPNELQVDLREGKYITDIMSIRGILGPLNWIKRINQGKSENLYGQSYLMTYYLFDQYGQDKVYDLVVSLRDNAFEKAFLQSFGLTEEEFHQKFMDYVKQYSSP